MSRTPYQIISPAMPAECSVSACMEEDGGAWIEKLRRTNDVTALAATPGDGVDKPEGSNVGRAANVGFANARTGVEWKCGRARG